MNQYQDFWTLPHAGPMNSICIDELTLGKLYTVNITGWNGFRNQKLVPWPLHSRKEGDDQDHCPFLVNNDYVIMMQRDDDTMYFKCLILSKHGIHWLLCSRGSKGCLMFTEEVT